jgi:hypothetical protein
MNIGMMWLFDKPLAGLVPNLIDAADYYRQKYGQVPNICMVNPKDAVALMNVGIVTIEPMKEILPKSLWIGMREVVDAG